MVAVASPDPREVNDTQAVDLLRHARPGSGGTVNAVVPTVPACHSSASTLRLYKLRREDR